MKIKTTNQPTKQTKQNKTKQNKTKQTKQNKKQNKTKNKKQKIKQIGFNGCNYSWSIMASGIFFFYFDFFLNIQII